MAFPELNDSVHNEQFGSAENTGNTSPANDNAPEALSSDEKADEKPEKDDDSVLKSMDSKKPTDTGSAEKAKVIPAESAIIAHHPDTELHQEEHTEETDRFEPTLLPEGTNMESITVDYFRMTKEELIKAMQNLIANRQVHQIGDDADIIKINFYKKHKSEIERKRKKFIEDGGNIEDFKPGEDPQELEFKELFKQYRDHKADYNRNLELVKQDNLKAKYAIIEEIKVLINRKESLNETFQDFRDLQKRWRNIGPVPQLNVKDLWETYNHNVEKFYDFIKINQELRDLDLKKNLESKLELCEKAEELIIETDIVKAFNALQKLHESWRDIGPVPHEMRDEIWNRFKDTTTKLNKNYQDHFEKLKEGQKKNLEQKALLCDKVEEIITQKIETARDWEDKSNEILELQKVWKSIGFAPKKDNNKIYQRFRAACDDFFNRKRDFFTDFKEEQMSNLQLKTELCLQAETLKESTEWKKTTEDLINIQKRWKEIGPVPRKYADQIWKRFRAACDEFFNRKSTYFANIDSKYEDNLQKKLDLIKEIANFKPDDDIEENFRVLKDFQRRWTEIGFVPLKNKEEVQNQYRDAINKHFDDLKIDEDRKNLLRFRNKVESMANKPKGNQKLRIERERSIAKLKQMENEITLWENNIGFFARTEKSEAMREEVQKKIDETRKKIVLLEARIRMIDSQMDEV